jgi:hypothetical protein
LIVSLQYLLFRRALAVAALRLRVGLANSGCVFVDESAEQIATA